MHAYVLGLMGSCMHTEDKYHAVAIMYSRGGERPGCETIWSGPAKVTTVGTWNSVNLGDIFIAT